MTALRLTAGKIHELPIGKVKPDPDQPRKSFDPDALKILASSIKTDGLLQPITVRSVNGHAVIVTGERRYRATKLAGLKTIKAILHEGADDAVIRGLHQVAENEIRQGLNHMELAELLHRLRTVDGKSDNELAKILKDRGMEHISRSGIANYIRLTELPDWAKEMIRDGVITGTHGRYILQASGLPDVLKKIHQRLKEELKWKGELTVTDVEEEVHGEMRQAGIDLNATWGNHIRLFKSKVCKGCEFYRKVDKMELCFNAAEFERKNAEAKALLKSDPEEAKKVATKAAIDRIDENEEFDAERKKRAAETREDNRKEEVEQLLENFLRAFILEQILPTLDDQEWFERLVVFMACGMPNGKMGVNSTGLMYDDECGSEQGLDGEQEEAATTIRRQELADFLKDPLDGAEIKTVATHCVKAMSREMIHVLASDLNIRLEPIFRISEEYLAIMNRKQLEVLAKRAQLESIAGWTGKKLKAELLLPENVDKIGVPADIAKLYKSPVSQETPHQEVA